MKIVFLHGNDNSLGQSLFEVLVALLLSALILTGLVRATIVSVRNSNFAKEQSYARDLGQKKISEIAGLAKEYPREFWQGGGLPYYVGLMMKFEEIYDGSEVRNCYRVDISPDNSGEVAEISVEVFWEKGTGPSLSWCGSNQYVHKIKFTTKVYKNPK